MKLLLCESPGKIHCLSKILGPDFTVLATIGHMRKINDSGAYKTGIDCKNNFSIDYVYDSSKKDNIKKIKEAAKKAEVIYSSSDLDREGEAISEEIYDLLKQYKSKIIRVGFNEITDKAVKDAIKNPIGFNQDLADAATARSVTDKLLGYRVSPVVLSTIGAPSAGRVQSALLRILSDKEEAIQQFKAIKYFDVFVDYKKGVSNLTGKLFKIKTKTVEKITDKELVDKIIESCQNGKYTVDDIIEKEKLIKPKLPLSTASLQQLASNIMNWSPSKTQKNAQSLYEKGYITYIRTDSVRFAPEFISAAKEFIEKNYGKKLYKGLDVPEDKNKDAQNAHESIRPTDLEKRPENMANLLDTDESKLYKLIYNYSLASLFVPAKVKDTDIILKNGDYYFKTSGRKVVFESFLVLTNDLQDVKKLPEFKKSEEVNDKETYSVEKETLPPQRYSEAGLVKVMQESGIGRPSTYAPTIETLKKREYIKIEKKSVYVTELGLKLNRILKKHFGEFFDPKYTATVEENLDKISNGELTKNEFLTDFWKEFEPIVLKASREINADKPKPEEVGRTCPDCGGKLVYREGKYGKFISCSRYPKCKHVESLDGTVSKQTEKTTVKCPTCKKGVLVKRTSKTGEVFYGCSRFSKGCKFTMKETEFNEKYKK